jgi:hypothetical protein
MRENIAFKNPYLFSVISAFNKARTAIFLPPVLEEIETIVNIANAACT